MRAMIGALGLASALSGSRRLRAARSGLRKMVAAFGEVQGGTALHAAAARNDLRLAKALLEAGVDPMHLGLGLGGCGVARRPSVGESLEKNQTAHTKLKRESAK